MFNPEGLYSQNGRTARPFPMNFSSVPYAQMLRRLRRYYPRKRVEITPSSREFEKRIAALEREVAQSDIGNILNGPYLKVPLVYTWGNGNTYRGIVRDIALPALRQSYLNLFPERKFASAGIQVLNSHFSHLEPCSGPKELDLTATAISRGLQTEAGVKPWVALMAFPFTGISIAEQRRAAAEIKYGSAYLAGPEELFNTFTLNPELLDLECTQFQCSGVSFGWNHSRGGRKDEQEGTMFFQALQDAVEFYFQAELDSGSNNGSGALVMVG